MITRNTIVINEQRVLSTKITTVIGKLDPSEPSSYIDEVEVIRNPERVEIRFANGVVSVVITQSTVLSTQSSFDAHGDKE